jgi:hypothetical protein
MFVNHAAFEEGMRHQRVTAYAIMPRQASEQEGYQVFVENIPSLFEEDLHMIQNKEEIPFWAQERGDAWAKLAKLKVNTPQHLFALSGHSAKITSDGNATFEFFDDFEDVEHDYYNFDYKSITTDYVGAHQGVATDGTYFYTSGGVLSGEPANLELYKFDLDWNLITKRDTTSDNPTGKTQINHIYLKDGVLYIGANQVGNEATWIMEYNASDLTPITYHELGNHGRSEGCAFHDGWWVVYSYKRYTSKFDTSWVHQADYNLTFTITPVNGYQGIAWIGDYIYCTIHDYVSPQAIDVYRWNGSGFDEVARLDLPESHCTQGLCLDPDGQTMWFAARMSVVDAEHDRVVKTTINNLWGSFDEWTVDQGAFGTDDAILTPTSAPAKCHLTAPPSTNPRRVIARIRDRSSPVSATYYLGKFSSWSNMLATFLRDDSDQIRTKAYIGGSGKTQRDTAMVVSTNVWYIVETKLSGADIEVDLDRVNKQSFADSDWNQSWTGLGWRTYTTAQDLDWILIAKYASPEPLILKRRTSGKADVIKAIVSGLVA